ncbi:MAG TPA: NAD(P)H-hydrate dehydratase [Candidatus Bathyarchaeia archaeon]|nr:NAD(P)H-hydrate dehydratase [Candidatus Bathyarchaeia archaeon]
MEETITSREMRALETNSEYFGVSRLLLMENAGHCVACLMGSKFEPGKSVAIFCGLGGNGGDGFVIARHLLLKDFKITIILAGRGWEITDKAALENWKALQYLKETIPMIEVADSSLVPDVKADIVVDALLGTGAKGELRPPILQLVRKINSMQATKIAVDMPTGVDADTGEVLGEAVKANITVTFYKPKKGLMKAKKYVGELVVKDIGLPKEFERFAGPGDVLSAVKPRKPESHKGDFGRLLVIGGSETFSGAPTLVAQAALRTGVDLAYVAAPEKTARVISTLSPDLITIKLKGDHLNPHNLDQLKQFIRACDAVAVGPGLGLHEETREAVRLIIEEVERSSKAVVLDADALKAFAVFKRELKVPSVLTPHAGEYETLTGKKLPENHDQKIQDVRNTAAKLNAVVLLKGSVDIISNGTKFKLNFTGNPGMTVGGTGDVLTGVVGAFLAQHVDPFEAAVAGAFVNGAAGDFVFEGKGAHMVASDLIKWIPHVLNDPMNHSKVRMNRGKTR